MQTPWGELADLDLSDHELAGRILAADKHQLIEGLVVECLFDQIVQALPACVDRPLALLDVETVVVDSGRNDLGWLGFVWARQRQPGLGRYLQALERCLRPWLLEYADGDFWATPVRDGQRAGPTQRLPELLQTLSSQRPQPFLVDASVRNSLRQRQAFWGFVSGYHQDRLAERVLLPRILINCAIQPWFRTVWNLDRAVILGDRVWVLEIKHKFPINQHPLHFGINAGEIGLLDRLSRAGVRCLHTILVKPQWSKEVGSMYLLNDLRLRTQAALIATVLDPARTALLRQQTSAHAGRHTSITGRAPLAYKRLAASSFSRLGLLPQPPAELAQNMVDTMLGTATQAVQDGWLRGLQAACGPAATAPTAPTRH